MEVFGIKGMVGMYVGDIIFLGCPQGKKTKGKGSVGVNYV